jgi:transposase
LLGIGRATVNRILRLHRETSSLEPRPRGGGNVSPIHGEMAELLATIVKEMPDATVAELTAVLIKRSRTPTSRSGVQRALARLGFSRKKSASSRSSATRRNTGSVARSSARS